LQPCAQTDDIHTMQYYTAEMLARAAAIAEK